MFRDGMAVFSTRDFIFPRHEEEGERESHPSHTLIRPYPPPQDFPGVSYHQLRRSPPFSRVGSTQYFKEAMQVVEDDVSDDGSVQILRGERKKIRLSMEQVKTLEKSFEVGNKIEPERKMQLARTLGLQPRQIAIWFQNRRARWKTKQLERDYDLLKRKFEKLKSDTNDLLDHNNKLHAELLALKGTESTGNRPINLNKETDGSWSNESDHKHVIFHSSIGTHHLQNSSRSSSENIQFQKFDQTITDESFCNMFMDGIVEDQTGFWTEHHHLH